MGMLCVNPTCTTRGRHSQPCDGTNCPGCHPRQAADGLNLCATCTTRISTDATDAAKLWTDLAHQLIPTGGHSERVARSDGPPAPNASVIDARTGIHNTLTTLARMICEERGVTIPTTTRGGHAYADTSPGACADLIASHSVWLAAHPAADEHAQDLHQAARDPSTRALAYPATRRDRIYIGPCPVILVGDDGSREPCGTRLYQSATQPMVTCPTCGVTDTIEQWQRWIVGECDGTAPAEMIATYLSVRWARPVDQSLVRKWSSLKKVEPILGEDGRPARDDRRRVLYQLSVVEAYARTLWGEPAAVRVSA